MATNTEPWGLTPLTTEGLATLGHPLSLSDFNQDAEGRYWRTIRGEKTYYPREWFDAAGTFTGTGTQPGDRAGQDDRDFFHQGTKWNWKGGQWNNPINWANVIGLAAAGGVGAAAAAPALGALLGGSGAAGGTSGGLTSGLTSGLGTNATVGSVLGNPLVQGGIKTGIDATRRGHLAWQDALNFVSAVPGANNIGGAVTKNAIARGAINAGVRSGLNSAATGRFDPKATAFDIASGAVPGVSASLTNSPIARRGLTAGMNIGLNAARTGKVDPVQAAVAGGRVLIPTTTGTSQTGSGMPTITRRLVDDGGLNGSWNAAGSGYLTPTGFTGFDDSGGDDSFGEGGGVDDGGDDGGWWVDDGGWGDGGDDGGVDVGPEPLPSRPTMPGSGLPEPTLPSTPTPGTGEPLPTGGTTGRPSAGLPLPSGGGGDTKGGVLDDLTKILQSPVGGLLGGFLSGLGQSLNQQKRQSFEGTAADPKTVMGDLGAGLKGLIGNYQARNAQGVSLPDAYVDLRTPVFTGGGTAMPVGIVPKGDASVGRPASLVPTAGIVPRAAVPDETGLSTQMPGVNLPGTTPGRQYPLSDKERALSALNLLGVS
jgi:hypothetical protein